MNAEVNPVEPTTPVDSHGLIGRIPVRNLWALMLYASDLYKALGDGAFAVEDVEDDLPDLVGRLLAKEVERRLQRSLAVGFERQERDLTRVRGRIDVLRTQSHSLLAQGRVACRFEALTIDTPRLRFVRAALAKIAQLCSAEVSRMCRALESRLLHLGVGANHRAPRLMKGERFGPSDAQDRTMVGLALLAFEMALPSEQAGERRMKAADRDQVWVRRLYEKAVVGLYEVALGTDWKVRPGQWQAWQTSRATSRMMDFLPQMQTDILLDHRRSMTRWVVDTKFTDLIVTNRFDQERVSSRYLYQMYAYLLSQRGRGDAYAENASGLLLHPAVGVTIDEWVWIQGHRIRFATVDLTGKVSEIKHQILSAIAPVAEV